MIHEKGPIHNRLLIVFLLAQINNFALPTANGVANQFIRYRFAGDSHPTGKFFFCHGVDLALLEVAHSWS